MVDPNAAVAEPEEELVDYEEEDAGAGGKAGADAGAGGAVKKGYVGIHSSGFKDFLLKPELLRAIVDCGFEHPSEGEREWEGGACQHGGAKRPSPRLQHPSPPTPPPSVQHECIPQAILGMDVLCQAKSGMGKTAVFVLSVLQQLEPVDGEVGAVVICHTRELAYQVRG